MADQPTAAEWKALKDLLMSPMGSIELRCDGFRLTIQMLNTGKSTLTYKPAVFIDGVIRWRTDAGEDCYKGEGPYASRFWHRRSQYLTKPKERARFRASSKRDQKMLREILGADYPDKRWDFYSPTWPSPGALINHLRKTCTDVQISEQTRERLRRAEEYRHAP